MKQQKILSSVKERFSAARKKVGFVQGLAIGLTTSSLITWAAVTIPHTFTAGTTISASEINANFQALATAMEPVTNKIIGTLGADLTISCVSTPVFPNDYNPPTWTKEGGGTFESYTIPATGLYDIRIEAPSSGTILGKLVIDGTPELLFSTHTKKLNVGQVVEVVYACDVMGGSTVVIDSSKSFFIIQQL